MPVVKVTDLAYGRLRSPDLDKQEEFLTAFGMVRADRTRNEKLYMRGTRRAASGIQAEHVIRTQGEPKYIGIAFHAGSEEDLEKLSRVEGATRRSRTTRRAGRRASACAPHRPRTGSRSRWSTAYGDALPKIPGQPAEGQLRRGNSADAARRQCARLQGRRARARRTSSASAISSCTTPQFEKTLGWYREMFGFRCSDEVYVGAKDNITGSFNRLDRGDDFVDHHAFFCIRSDKKGLNHLSYEAADIDDIMIGHDILAAKGYEHFWGIGRHSLGSQVYDYWGDPWGRVHEHWADTDVLNASIPANLISREELAGPWGGPPPEKFMHHAVG